MKKFTGLLLVVALYVATALAIPQITVTEEENLGPPANQLNISSTDENTEEIGTNTGKVSTEAINNEVNTEEIGTNTGNGIAATIPNEQGKISAIMDTNTVVKNLIAATMPKIEMGATAANANAEIVATANVRTVGTPAAKTAATTKNNTGKTNANNYDVFNPTTL